ncbi:MAG TPA: serine/threonine-protein kinase [Burkholderiales bacterium]|nr:serine/threonine-protein kinase [Burkholderiales bacterium]
MEAPQLGRYEIVAELGRGAMGIVYKATDPELGRTVAIKTVNMALGGDDVENYQKRFTQEARAAGGLNHPTIVTIYDIGRTQDIAYMAMEFIEGTELRTILQEGPRLTVAQAVAIAAQVADGMAYAHARGIVHRDIKPANIMVLDDGSVKITDFGIARMRASQELTQTGTMLGSPKYMSPEQALGRRATHQSDIFSLGVVLYEMLAGASPFTGDSVGALMYQIAHVVPPAPSVLNRDVPELLDYVVSKALAKSLDARYANAEDLARDLRQSTMGQTSSGDRVPVPRRAAGSLAAGSNPSLTDTAVRTELLAPVDVRTRQADAAAGESDTTVPAHVLSRTFDSAEATQRLVALNATAPEDAQLSTTQVLSATPPPPKRRWRRRDWILVGALGLLGLFVARRVSRRPRNRS